jgi:hypothetical protein
MGRSLCLCLWNKWAAFVTSVTLLFINGRHFVIEPAEGVEFMEGLTSDQIPEVKFKSWLSHGSTKILYAQLLGAFDKLNIRVFEIINGFFKYVL